ncbi:Protein tyrosine phosphatase_ receptor type_ C, partial [Caligus rogercresseyi]
RNRYQDVVPFDSTRVKLRSPLKTEEETDSSDYINASYIAGFVSVHSTCTSRIRGDSCISSVSGSNGGGGKSNLNNNNNSSSSSSSKNPSRHGSPRKCRSYIAAQGPSNGTLPLFWDMIWEENVRVIVMLTNCVEGGLKCSLYWPHLLGGSRRFFNNIQVLLYDVQEAPDYTIRKFDVSKAEEERSSSSSREIVQIQYKAWPDRTAPRDPRDLLQLIQVTRALANMYNSNEGPGPILVHCSAGVGRSGKKTKPGITVIRTLKSIYFTSCTNYDGIVDTWCKPCLSTPISINAFFTTCSKNGKAKDIRQLKAATEGRGAPILLKEEESKA